MSGETITLLQWERFFTRLSKAYSVSNALSYAKINRATAYRVKREQRSISARWEQALADGVEYLEDTARKRAVDGVKKETGVYYQGELVGTEIEIKYSDGLLRAMLAARDPRYRLDNPSQVQALVMQELGKMLDVLQRKLAPDVYQQIIDVLAVGIEDTSGVIDVSPEGSAAAQITDTESTE